MSEGEDNFPADCQFLDSSLNFEVNYGRKETMVDSLNDDNGGNENEIKCFDSPVKNIYSMNDQEYQQTMPQLDHNGSNDILNEPLNELLLENSGNDDESEESESPNFERNESGSSPKVTIKKKTFKNYLTMIKRKLIQANSKIEEFLSKDATNREEFNRLFANIEMSIEVGKMFSNRELKRRVELGRVDPKNRKVFRDMLFWLKKCFVGGEMKNS